MRIFRHRFLSFVVTVPLVLLLSACHDDDVPGLPPVDPSPIILSEQQVEIGSEGRYYSVEVAVVEGEALTAVRAATDADWIQLDADTLSRGGNLLFYVNSNDSVHSREGIINLRLGDNPSEAVFTVHQRSEAEDDDNGIPGGALTRKARVGYGYNMLIDYMDPASATEPILDYQKLVQAERKWGTIIAEEGRAEQSLNIHSAYSIEEMSSWMSKQTSTEVNILFFNKSVNKFKKISEYKSNQQTYGYSSLSKVVATRYIDEGKLESIIRQGEDIFTAEFRELYNQVNQSPTQENVNQLIRKFGTHLVTYSDLGGRLDYMVNFRSEETSRTSVEKYLKYKNGKQVKNEEVEEASHAICTSGTGLTFDIYGGTEEAIGKLSRDATVSDRYGQVNSSLLGGWLNSIRISDLGSVSLVRCLLQPIWQLFTNPDARTQIISRILALSFTEGGDVSGHLEELGLDNYYKLNITGQMLSFKDDSESTLAKIVYWDGRPKVEICNEYVPELRGDKRITILYPIFRQQTNIRRGIFPGDGENPPAEVTFDNAGGCYVRQLDGYKPGDKISTLYCIDGAFYPTNFGIEIPEYPMTVEDEWLRIFNHPAYPVVKIGAGFWTRKNAVDEMGFGKLYENDYYEDWEYRESVYDGVLYAEIFNPVDDGKVNSIDFGSDASKWYLPTKSDLDALVQYIGKNPKALYPKQQTGFEATFDGCEMYYDFVSGKQLDGYHLLYKGERCFLVFKYDRAPKFKNGTALMLLPDYTLTQSPIKDSDGCRYPVRMFRTKQFKHQNLK